MNATATHKHGPIHTYWLYSDGGGKLGPFTKSEARAIVKASPEIRFRARRDGEVEWKDAEVRLAPKKSAAGLIWTIALAVLAIAFLGTWWSANHSHRSITEVPPAAVSAPEVTPPKVASGS